MSRLIGLLMGEIEGSAGRRGKGGEKGKKIGHIDMSLIGCEDFNFENAM